MTPDPSTPSPSPTGPTTSGGSDWPAQATDTIVSLIDTVKGKTTGPATTAVRGAIYGLLAAIIGTAALVLFLVVLVRGIDIGVQALLQGIGVDKAGRSTWMAHAITGLVFFLLPGLWLMRRGARAAGA